jgi:hypothetical protein
MTELLKELSPPAWRLLKSDEFNGAELGQTMWSLCREGPSAWNRHMADRREISDSRHAAGRKLRRRGGLLDVAHHVRNRQDPDLRTGVVRLGANDDHGNTVRGLPLSPVDPFALDL